MRSPCAAQYTCSRAPVAVSAAQAFERLAEVLGRAAAALPAAEPLWRQRLSRALALELPLTAVLEAEVHPHC